MKLFSAKGLESLSSWNKEIKLVRCSTVDAFSELISKRDANEPLLARNSNVMQMNPC